jgi:TIR domain
MQVFISWSGERSKAIAVELSSWLSQTIQLIEAWISTDIEKGSRWGPEITARLQSSLIGVICVTPENVSSPWLLFEAGAISNTKGAHVCTLLVGLKSTDVPMPLAQFQATPLERGEVKRLLETMNAKLQEAGEKALSQSTLDAVFDNNWERLEAKLLVIMSAPEPAVPVKRDTSEVLEEMLLLLRDMERRSIVLDPNLLAALADESLPTLAEGMPVTAAALARKGIGLPSDLAARRRATARMALWSGAIGLTGLAGDPPGGA